MATVTISPAPKPDPPRVVTLVMSEDEARALVRVADSMNEQPWTERSRNPYVYGVISELLEKVGK